MFVAHYLDDDRLVLVTKDLEIALVELVMPHTVGVVAGARINMATNDELSVVILAWNKLLF